MLNRYEICIKDGVAVLAHLWSKVDDASESVILTVTQQIKTLILLAFSQMSKGFMDDC